MMDNKNLLQYSAGLVFFSWDVFLIDSRLIRMFLTCKSSQLVFYKLQSLGGFHLSPVCRGCVHLNHAVPLLHFYAESRGLRPDLDVFEQ